MSGVVATVRKVGKSETAELAAVLAKALGNDPMSVHLLPDDASRVSRLTDAFQLLLKKIYMPHQECYTLGAFPGGAVWLPPGKYPLSFWQQLRLLPGAPSIFGLSRVPRALLDLNQMEKMHPKATPHWYLAFLGVIPSEQGKGIGSALLRKMLERCDAEKMPAYLENTREQNLPLYQKHGFQVVTECDIHKGPHLWGMWRAPQK